MSPEAGLQNKRIRFSGIKYVIGSQAEIINSIIASGANIEDNAHLRDQTYNHEAPTDDGGKKT